MRGLGIKPKLAAYKSEVLISRHPNVSFNLPAASVSGTQHKWTAPRKPITQDMVPVLLDFGVKKNSVRKQKETYFEYAI